MHMMDISSYAHLPPETSSADICFGVTDSLVKFLQPSGRPVYFINHGLSKRFIEKNIAALATGREGANGRQIIVGYVGNLLMGAIDRPTMIRVVRDHPEIRFIFWGQYKVGQDKLDAHRVPEAIQFVEALEQAPNVVLKGPVAPEVLSKEIEVADCFWLCYKKETTGIWEGSNSHKLLEYLITGKPVITHKVETYEHYEDILYMVKDMHNDNYPQLFDRIVSDLARYSSEPLRKGRIEMALANAYENQIKYIESKIAEKGLYR
jgi:glycosyltransferase involved in cell wall biosynthesis